MITAGIILSTFTSAVAVARHASSSARFIQFLILCIYFTATAAARGATATIFSAATGCRAGA